MIEVEEHLTAVVALATPVPAEEIPISAAGGRVLAEDLVARLAVPPFDNSAMDGFAVRAADLTLTSPEPGSTMTSPEPVEGIELEVVGDIPAGAAELPPVGPGQAVRIMTGAPLPAGADAVVPVEATDQPLGDVPLPATVRVIEPVSAGRHIRRAGEDVAPGDPVLSAGQVMTPAAVSAAISVGHGSVLVRRRPRVAVLSTGTELVAPGTSPGIGQIPDSNSALLAGLAERFGAEVVLARAVSDEPDEFRRALVEAGGADAVVTSGGVSVGAFEVVRQVTEGQVDFVTVAMQPGKPQGRGMVRVGDGRQVPMLALPGNPVSVFVSAWVFLRPLVARLAGTDAPWRSLRVAVAQGWRTPPGRRQYAPVVFESGAVRSTHRLGSGSHLVASLPAAQGLAVVPAEVDEVAAGDELEVFLID